MLKRKFLTQEQALQKARHYCAYQERSHSEAREKLYSLGLYKTQVEQCLAQLIANDYLNEERFATQFAGGKFRMKQWGRVKIKYELKQKQVSDYCIKKALQQISDADYAQTLTKLRKAQDYLLQKGYETDLIQQTLQRFQNKDGE